MNSNFNLPAGLTTRDTDGNTSASAPIVCDGCGHAKTSTKFIQSHGAELCAACDAQWTAQAELDARAMSPRSPNFENSPEAFLMRD